MLKADDDGSVSVRISNELGAGRPRAAKFSILVVIMSSVVFGLVFFSLVLVLQDVYGVPFTNSPDVVAAVTDLAVVFAFTLLLSSVQPVLTGLASEAIPPLCLHFYQHCFNSWTPCSGVAVGAGWQTLVAYINLGCYYLVGIPVGCLLAYYFDLGVKVTLQLLYCFIFSTLVSSSSSSLLPYFVMATPSSPR